ncbi:hypothetical protein CT0861_02859 [Colletotrichum tofieldiae]|uniref:Uncharacterized protein n=1 Tax=Colletotrichum tofieldiae TaxID=708197 RepID=A0A166ULW9_9PEZI|nr:hypothetical protein CT0861_02859 [Colletotrichum tofieldiae]
MGNVKQLEGMEPWLRVRPSVVLEGMASSLKYQTTRGEGIGSYHPAGLYDNRQDTAVKPKSSRRQRVRGRFGGT